MSTDTKAILFGRRSTEEIAAAIRRSPAITGPVETRGGNSLILGFVKISEGGGDFRNLTVFDGQEIGDDLDVYSGERTLISCGAYGSSVAIVEAAASAFGGYVQNHDGGDPAPWRMIPPGPAMELSRDEKFAIDMAASLSPQETEIMRKLMDDPRKLAALAAALADYEAAPAAAPRP